MPLNIWIQKMFEIVRILFERLLESYWDDDRLGNEQQTRIRGI